MPLPAASPVPVRTLLRRFRRNRGGSAAVEFSLVAPLGYATASDLKSKFICLSGSVANVLFDCTNGIYVDVENYPSFANVTMSSQIDASGNFITNNLKYCPGNAGAIVVVRLFYQWPLFVTGLGYNIASLTGSKRLLYGTAAFRNEPFVASPAPC